MARPFRFKLETVLKLRKRKEDEHKRIVARRLRQLNVVRWRAVHIEHQIKQEVEAVRAGRTQGTISVQNIARGRHWLSYLQRTLLEARARVRVVEGQLAQERAELARVAKDAKALEKLKERQARRHEEEQKRLERRELDELAILRFPHPEPAGRRTAPSRAGQRRRQAELVSMQE